MVTKLKDVSVRTRNIYTINVRADVLRQVRAEIMSTI
jgi:hypothetical protein